jgi:drug/metabolite transporter (DMT)-like permease
MKTKTIGMILIVLGIIMTVYTGFNIQTTKKVVDIGPIEINKEENNPVKWKPIVGILIIVVGGVLVAKGNKS